MGLRGLNACFAPAYGHHLHQLKGDKQTSVMGQPQEKEMRDETIVLLLLLFFLLAVARFAMGNREAVCKASRDQPSFPPTLPSTQRRERRNMGGRGKRRRPFQPPTQPPYSFYIISLTHPPNHPPTHPPTLLYIPMPPSQSCQPPFLPPSAWC